MDITVIDPRSVRDISNLLLDDQGRLKVVDAAVLANTTVQERALFGVRHACYVLPTTELIEHLRQLIAGRRALEIGAGNGVVARALGIPASDNHQQTWLHIRSHYESLGQPVIQYGDNVEKLDAAAAIKKHKPDVVLACWVTHRYDPTRHWAGGNQDGVDEKEVLRNCAHYVFVGNEQVHKHKAIWELPHSVQHPEFLFSRAANGTREFIAQWEGAEVVR